MPLPPTTPRREVTGKAVSYAFGPAKGPVLLGSRKAAPQWGTFNILDETAHKLSVAKRGAGAPSWSTLPPPSSRSPSSKSSRTWTLALSSKTTTRALAQKPTRA